jgi:hypothetical protein
LPKHILVSSLQRSIDDVVNRQRGIAGLPKHILVPSLQRSIDDVVNRQRGIAGLPKHILVSSLQRFIDDVVNHQRGIALVHNNLKTCTCVLESNPSGRDARAGRVSFLAAWDSPLCCTAAHT